MGFTIKIFKIIPKFSPHENTLTLIPPELTPYKIIMTYGTEAVNLNAALCRITAKQWRKVDFDKMELLAITLL